MNKALDTINLEDTIPDLVKQSQVGDRGAFDSLVKRYQVCAMKTATRILADADEADEAVQDGFVTAYLKIKKLKTPEKFGPWLLRIIINAAIDRQRSAVRRKQLFQRAADRAPSNHHDNVIDTKELQSAIRSAMGKLTKTQTRAIGLFGIEELSHKEVAEVLGCTPEAARWHVYQARIKLKVLLKDYIQ